MLDIASFFGGVVGQPECCGCIRRVAVPVGRAEELKRVALYAIVA